MKRFFKLFLLFFFTSFIVSGCNGNHTPAPRCRVVTGVDIACSREHMLIRRHYTDNKKMEAVLLYLRLLKTKGPPDIDPDRLREDVYEITLHLSDGNRRVFRQKDHRYFSRDSRPWVCIDPAQAARLYALMRQLPSDPFP